MAGNALASSGADYDLRVTCIDDTDAGRPRLSITRGTNFGFHMTR